ncbi:EcsC family protein [Chitinophagaceae bacterium LB-8]|uniref:EcsC family protein n=1 Tax=Paraflavisolibacter caeni TaxID=2982496 RepID=A0A9X3B8L9_9BACT|nr:EcsC family protein [Paraflavisolibacter caeni]MCU7549951.1 EcsC family protein [Paraflavisolibacter caeni]
MSEVKNPGIIMKVLDWAYEKAINGAGLVESASMLAGDYQKMNSDREKAIDSLIQWQTTKCATAGFITGIGGMLTLPIAIPANISSVLFMQLRMVAAIAIMRGYNPKSDQVQSLAYICLTGSAATDLLKSVGIRVGRQITESAIQKISSNTIAQINEKVGFRLLSKFGSEGLINLSKAVPLIGGVVSGAVDAASTKVIGKTAKHTFAY